MKLSIAIVAVSLVASGAVAQTARDVRNLSYSELPNF